MKIVKIYSVALVLGFNRADNNVCNVNHKWCNNWRNNSSQSPILLFLVKSCNIARDLWWIMTNCYPILCLIKFLTKPEMISIIKMYQQKAIMSDNKIIYLLKHKYKENNACSTVTNKSKYYVYHSIAHCSMLVIYDPR